MRCSTTNAAWPSLRWKTAGIDAERLQRAHAADAEDDFLLDAGLAVAAVQPRRQLAVPGRVLFERRVEQIQRDAAEPQAPHRDQHGAIAERHRRDARLAVRRQRRFDRRVGPVEPLVAFFLPAFRGHVLVEVALRIHEADADQRHAEIARLLAVIAGEGAEAAGVDRQRLVQRELRREVGDRLPAEMREMVRPPRIPGGAGIVQHGDGPIVEAQEFRVGRGGFELRARDDPEHAHRVVGGRAPQRVVEPPEHLSRLAVPAPPQIHGELVETVDAFGKRRKVGVSVHDL